MRTMHLFPVDVETELPKPEETADCDYYCIGTDSNKYAVKRTSDNPEHPSAPFDELFGYELARIVGIAVPQYNIIRIANSSELGFGSVWEGSVVKGGLIRLYHLYKHGATSPSTLDYDLFLRKLSAIYALDLFLCNEDRHTGNYLFKDLENTQVVMAMDFGRSWSGLNCPVNHNGDVSCVCNRLPLYYLRHLSSLGLRFYLHPPKLTFSLLHDEKVNIHNNLKPTNTYKNASLLWSSKYFGPIHGGAFFDVLEKIEKVTTPHIQSILNLVPDEWCSPSCKKGIADWWGSERRIKRIKRINKIKLGYQNGTLV